jgi:hypothetical protein
MGKVARKRRVGRVALIVLLVLTLANLAVVILPVPSTRGGGAPSLPRSIGNDVRTGLDPHLGQVASALSGRRTAVRCWSREDWKERTSELERRFPAVDTQGPWRAHTFMHSVPVVHFSPEICAELRALARGRVSVRSSESPEALAWSVSALVHESMHASGVLGEAKAECYGIQTIRTAAMLLGRTSDEGRYLAALYWKRWYRWHDLPYRSRECRNGGRLDLHRNTNAWP